MKQDIDVIAGLASAIKVLLGDKVASEMEKALGPELAKQFLKLHAAYDHLSEKYPDSDPVNVAMGDTAPSFDSFEDYTRFLQRVQAKTQTMRVSPGPEFNKVLVAILSIIAKAEKSHAVTSALVPKEGSAKTYDTALMGLRLPAVPLSVKSRDALPYSYPSYEATAKIVGRTWDEKHYSERFTTEMNKLVTAALKNLSEHIKHSEHIDVCPCDLAIAAQEYLMSRNWIKYGLESVGEVSLYTAMAGYEHSVTLDGDIVLSNSCKVHYEFIGANLERLLRRVIFNLERDVMSGTMLAGRQPAVDLVVACCSEIVQDSAREWLKTLHETLR